MYRKFLYNDNCILDLETRNVYFDFQPEYKKYLDWRLENKELESEIQNDKIVTRNFNGGQPHIIKTKNGFEKKLYTKGGQIIYHFVFIDDKKVKDIRFNSNGDVSRITEYDSEERIINEIAYFDNSKKIRFEKTYRYQSNSNTSKEIHYFESSVFYKIKRYKNDICISEELYHEEPNTLQKKVKYLDYKDNSFEETLYFIDGNINKKVFVESGFTKKEIIYNYKPNKPNSIIEWDTHFANFTKQDFDNDGKKIRTTSYKYDNINDVNIPHGDYTEFHPNDNIKLYGKIENGKLQGDWKFFTEDGEEKSTHTFFKGKLMNETSPYFSDKKHQSNIYHSFK